MTSLRGGSTLIKTFLFGILLGIATAIGLLLAFPVVDQHREISIISVAPNGGTVESFHINVPMDRIMVGTPAMAAEIPEGLEWPEDELLANVSVELFKIRNARDVVVGLASRTAARSADEDSVDWVMHFPARGSIFVDMATTATVDGLRGGEIAAGSREFEELGGYVSERWVSDTSGDDDAQDGRIELSASYIGKAEPLE